MAIKNVDNKIKKVASKTPSKWRESARWRRENRAWLEKSFEIALQILEAIEEKEWSQKKLAHEMEVSPQQVSKILKGRENLRLSTIAKLEKVLDTQLVQVPSTEPRVEFEFENAEAIGKDLYDYEVETETHRMAVEETSDSQFEASFPGIDYDEENGDQLINLASGA